MKALMILGAIVGFLIGSSFGLAGNSPWSAALWRACAAAFVTAILARWWGQVWRRNLNNALRRRHDLRPPGTAETKPGT
jgi:O-antigen/teichoic acid export membrane protein